MYFIDKIIVTLLSIYNILKFTAKLPQIVFYFNKVIMKNIFLLSALLIGFYANAQLFVKPTDANNPSYIYVNDSFIYVEQDVELETNRTLAITADSEIPNILLRGESQLLQGEGTDQNNKGTGEISIFQEGTVNNFDYNFWASPVGASRLEGTGVAGAARGNGNSVFTFQNNETDNVIFTPTSVTGAAVPTVNNGLNGTSATGSLSIAHFWLFGFNSSAAGFADWDQIANTGSLAAGYGFTMKGVSGTDTNTAGETTQNNDGTGQRYDFRGRPNNGNITGITVNADESVLVGNPFPSAMDLSYFLLENSGSGTTTVPVGPNNTSATFTRNSITTGVAYFWESDPSVNSHFLEDYSGGYGVFSPMGSTATDGMYIPPTFQNYDELGVGIGNNTGTGNVFARRFSPIGQGFFLDGAAAGSQTSNAIIFSNRHRVFVQEGPSSQFRSSQNNDPVPGIGVQTYYPDVTNMLKISKVYLAIGINDLYTRQLGIGMMDWATEEFDVAIDAPINGALGVDAAFRTEHTENIASLGSVIAGVPKDEYQWIPLNIQANETSELRIKVIDLVEFDYDNIYLLDALTATYYDIYNDEAVLQLEEGIYKDRFYVRFTTETAPPAEDEEEQTAEEETNEDISIDVQDSIVDTTFDSFTIIQNNTLGQLEIYNPENVTVKDVSMFDLAGKQIFNEKSLGNENQFIFSTNNMATGVYIVQFTTKDNLTKGYKVSVSN